MHQPLLDRADELSALRHTLESVTRGRGTVVVLEGAAGTGKSALLSACRQSAEQAGARVLDARAGELERDYPFGVVRQLYGPALESADEALRRDLLSDEAAPAAWVLGISRESSGLHAAGFAAMRAVYRLTARLAQMQATVLLADDLHWADSSSLQALDFLARRIGDLPVMVLAAFRPQDPGAPAALLDQLRTIPEATRLSLRSLGRESVTRLVRRRIRDASPDVCTAFHSVTSGNPLYVQELLRSLVFADQTPSPAEVHQASVPTLGERVLRRASQVAPEADPLVRAMAVLGDGGDLATAAKLANVPEDRAGQLAFELRRIEVLCTEDPFVFEHPLIRRSVYDFTPLTRREAIHRDAGELLKRRGAPPETVAAQLRPLTPSGDSLVATSMLLAAEKALERAAADEAAGWLERALAENAPEPARGYLLMRLGLVDTLRRDPLAVTHLREAYAQADDPALQVAVAVALSEVLAHAGQWHAAIEVLDAAESQLPHVDAEMVSELAAIRAAITLYDPKGIDDFDARRSQFAQLAQGQSWPARALAGLLAAEAAERGRTAEALRLAEHSLADGRLLGERGAGGWAVSMALAVLVACEAFDDARTAIDQTNAAAQSAGSVFAEITATGYDAWLHARLGELATAESKLGEVWDGAVGSGLAMVITTFALILVDVLLERDSVGHVSDLVERTAIPPDFLDTASGAMLLEARGTLRLSRQERERAIEDLRAAGRIWTTLRFGPTWSCWRSRLARALSTDDAGEALLLAREELELARKTQLKGPQAIALRTLGVLEPGDAGLAHLRESVELLEDSPLRLERARSLVELGAALRRANRRAEARRQLGIGLELAEASGAQRLARLARQELRAAGDRRRRTATTGPESLTASELRVVELAAAGATNVEIAQELYVSLKTVETHLYRAYLKLGLAGHGSRKHLAALLETAAS